MLCALAVAGAAFAQGTVNWTTIPFGAFTAQTNSTMESPLYYPGPLYGGTIGNTFNQTVLPNGFHFELLYLPGAPVSTPTTLTALEAWQDSGLSAVPTFAGFGRVQPVNATTAATVPWAAGITDNIMLAGWSSSLGATWANVIATINSGGISYFGPGVPYLGLSSTGYMTPNGSTLDPGATFIGGGPNINGTPIQSLNTQLYALDLLLPGPEPSTLALTGLSGLTLLLFRRRRN